MKALPSAPAPRPGFGSICADELLPLREFGVRLGLGNKSLAEIQRKGLRTSQFGKLKFVLGADAIEFFRELAEQQASKPNP